MERRRALDQVDIGALAEAKRQARMALDELEVPVGAVVVRGGEIVSAAHNLCEQYRDPTAHAEILAIREASRIQNTWRLEDCKLYVTLEPCVMCAGAIVAARIQEVIYAYSDSMYGAVGSAYNICADPRTKHQARVIGPIEVEQDNGLKEFFKSRRVEKKPN